jgi:tetratricopeptide (TPR) repeat protein
VLITRAYCQTTDELNKYRIAQALEQAGEYNKALEFYRELYQLAPGNFVYFDGLRRAYMNLKKYDDAKVLIERRLTSDTSNVVLMCQLADVFYKNEQRDSAIFVWDNALKIAPKNQNVYRVVASSMADDRLFNEAIDVYRKGEKELNSPVIFANEIAQLYFMSANYKESLHELLKMLDAQRNTVTVANIEGRLAIYSSSKDVLEQMTDEMRKEVSEHPNDVEYHQLLAFLYMEQKNYSSAYDVYRWLDQRLGAKGAQLLEFADRAYNDEAYQPAADAYKEVETLSKENAVIAQAVMGYANSMCALAERDYRKDDLTCADVDTSSHVAEITHGSSISNQLTAALASYQRIIDDFSNTQFMASAVLNCIEIRMNYFHDLPGVKNLIDKYNDILDEYHDVKTSILIRFYMKEGDFRRALDTAVAELTNGEAHHEQQESERYVTPTWHLSQSGGFVEAQAGGAFTGNLHDRLEYHAALALYYLGMYDSANYYLKEIMSNPKSDVANDAIRLSNIINDNRGNPGALREYADASAMLITNRIPEAVAMLEELIRDYPQMPLADNARFDLADAYCKIGKVQEALRNYSILAKDSTGIFADKAEFRICRTYEEVLHERSKAITEYEDFLVRFPNSIYQDMVRERLRSLMEKNS